MDTAEVNECREGEEEAPVQVLRDLLREADDMPVMMDEAILIRYVTFMKPLCLFHACRVGQPINVEGGIALLQVAR